MNGLIQTKREYPFQGSEEVENGGRARGELEGRR
jgi:hypothetical protein